MKTDETESGSRQTNLQPIVDRVVDAENKGSDSNHVVAPRKNHQRNCGNVMDHHLSEVLKQTHETARPQNRNRPATQRKSVALRKQSPTDRERTHSCNLFKENTNSNSDVLNVTIYFTVFFTEQSINSR